MAFSYLSLLLPCHSFEDFPVHAKGIEADQLLAAWTSLWHPALIAGAGTMPDWDRADEFSLDSLDARIANSDTDDGVQQAKSKTMADQTASGFHGSASSLLLIPIGTRFSLNDAFLKQAGLADSTTEPEDYQNQQTDSALLINRCESRQSILHAIREHDADFATQDSKLNQRWADDFFALGYSYLQIKLMTQVLRYSSNLNHTRFNDAVVHAAQAVMEFGEGQAEMQSDQPEIENRLTACFDLLMEEKNSYYPVQADLLQLVLLSDRTLGEDLEQELAWVDSASPDHKSNLLVTGQLAKQIEQYPKTKSLLQTGIQQDRVSIVGGLESELCDPLMSIETTTHQIQTGNQTIHDVLGATPIVFARRKFGITSTLPGILEQSNYTGAIHAAMDAGKFPQGTSGNIRWEGEDGRSIQATGLGPLDANATESFLNLAIRIGEQVDSAHVATMIFAHWPGRTCQTMQDLIHSHRYVPLFGEFVTFEEYYDELYDPGYGDRFSPDDYRHLYLSQSIAASQVNPISRFVDYRQGMAKIAAARNWIMQECVSERMGQSEFETQTQTIETLQADIETATRDSEYSTDALDRVNQFWSELTGVGSVVEVGSAVETSAGSAEKNDSGDVQFFNPSPFPRRVSQWLGHEQGSGSVKTSAPIFLADMNAGSESHIMLDLPPLGTVSLTRQSQSPGSDPIARDPQILTSERTMRNEFFELEIDQASGGIRSFNVYQHRKNLLTQQLSIRIPGEKDAMGQPLSKTRYAQMVVDTIQPAQAKSRLTMQMISTGRLMDGDTKLAGFRQTVTVTRGLRTANVSVELTPEFEFTQNQNHYICSRMAFKDESAIVSASTHQFRHSVYADWFHAPEFIEIDSSLGKTTLLTSGLPFHRRSSRRMVDSLLMVSGENRTRFEFEIGVGIDYGHQAAINSVLPIVSLMQPANQNLSTTQMSSNGWLFHFSSKNIWMSWCRPLFNADGKCDGVQMRIRETEDRGGQLRIRAPKALISAGVCDFLGHQLRSVDVEDNLAKFSFCGADYFQIQMNWNP